MKIQDLYQVSVQFEKLAFDPMDQIESLLQESFTLLRAAYLIHQHNHWESCGVPQYGDHLLYQRLYESVQGDIDALAERIIGTVGVKSLQFNDGKLNQLLNECLNQLTDRSILERALMIEQKAKEKLIETQRVLSKSSVSESFGLTEDLLPAIISHREESLYLLKQRARN